ncbi:MAG TPA: peptidase dimerization domain-containing protein, partial [Thermomicrobiales bacterium]|nr:peptidase dimerization domain-containing protein [Thermomicrobiales bacterium]
LDCAITWHPGIDTSVWASSSLAVNNIKFRFRGRTAHAAGNPESGRSALDAVELMNIGVNYLREHMIEKARIHYVITHGGGAPNVVPDDCEVWYFIRSPERYQVDELTERVRKIAQGAAMMTETTLEENFISGAYNMLPNTVMSREMAAILEELGPIAFDEEDYAYGRAVAAQYPENLRVSNLVKRHHPADIANDGLLAAPSPMRDAGELGSGSTDVADVSWITPTAQFRTTCFALGVPGHSWANTATGGVGIGHKGMIHAAKGMALTATRLIDDPALLKAAQDEFAESTKGRPYQCPIPPDVQPRRP